MLRHIAEHVHRAAQMALGAPEPLDDLRMGSVQEIFTHALILSPTTLIVRV